MESYFIGIKTKQTFLVISTKNKYININIYTPDKFSKNEDFYEKYSLGKVVLSTKYDTILLP